MTFVRRENLPLYIVIAGQGGAGKEGAANFIAQVLEAQTDRRVTITREPSDGFREKVFKANAQGASGIELARLFYEDGADVEKKIVQPAINSGLHVVSVRARESTWAYQIPKGARQHDLLKLHRK